ncbi:DNA primase [Salimicrobium halophilum]|uniref:DNA primase n=1 Tax=Salimicrobium halophilum TaxID=86666 RepID=A0A1G8PQY0_9BACI|nr:DNA primase [Salimicrobium halophilum]SDI94843.1 DNA primase [Salimicrobium halophilum]
MDMPGHIPEEIVEEVRKQSDIVDVVGEHVELKKQGRNYFGLCPFHGESTPSFSVSPEKQIFHCFGCGKGGNVFTFLMEKESWTFIQAVEALASKNNISLPENNQSSEAGNDDGTQRMLEAHQWLSKLYHHLLVNTAEGKEALHYLTERGFTREAIDTFQLGYAPDRPGVVATFLEKKGYHPQEMVKAGLLSSTENGEYLDRFRGRIIFPLRNHLGKTVAFAGRSLGDGQPKYLNSPETSVFHKGKLLYNFDLARGYIRKQNTIVLLEGYADVISAYEGGIKGSIATMGTSVTPAQAQLMNRYAEKVIICYDGDEPGIEASVKTAKELQKAGIQVYIARVPNRQDPDEFIKAEGGDRFKKEVLDTSEPFVGYLMRYYRSRYNLQSEGDRFDYIETVIREVAKLDRAVEREYYLQEIANEFSLSLETLKEEMAKWRPKQKDLGDNQSQQRYTKRSESQTSPNKPLPAFHNAERKLIAYMMREPYIADIVKENISASFNIETHQIIATHLYAYYEENETMDISEFIETFEENRLKDLVADIAAISLTPEVPEKEIEDYIYQVQTEQWKKQNVNELRKEMKEVEKQDPIRAAELAMQLLKNNQEWKSRN